ncbi:hypothetical protein Tco_0433616 [Tanacetum coccineum]
MQEVVEIATELMDKKIHTFADRQTKNKRKTGEKKLYKDLNPYALSAIITTMVRVLPNATSAIELAIWPVIAGVLLMATLVTSENFRI